MLLLWKISPSKQENTIFLLLLLLLLLLSNGSEYVMFTWWTEGQADDGCVNCTISFVYLKQASKRMDKNVKGYYYVFSKRPCLLACFCFPQYKIIRFTSGIKKNCFRLAGCCTFLRRHKLTRAFQSFSQPNNKFFFV